ncbi:MAG: YgdI/YgdR family lipoprotein [Gammaproteobacteria bacterium]|nr:YgdI/YgdR family lipoprotein [Gammaproteobacteria bacterium]
MKIIKLAFAVCFLFLLNGCSSNTVIPNSGNIQTIITNADTDNNAVEIANKQARRICTLQGKEIKIIYLDTRYQGINDDQKALVEQAKQILPENKTHGAFTPENYIYKANLMFKCI